MCPKCMLPPTIVLHIMLLVCHRTLHVAPSLGPWTARGGVAAVMALAYAKRRLRGKQPAPAVYVVDGPALQAIADEGWSELTALDDEKRKKHVHWVHVKTDNPEHKQPETFSKEEFWLHMCRVYKDTYPEAANRTDSIMLFGLVARELHKKSFRMEERNPHNHFIAYTAQQNYWKPVARCSLQKYGVKLHAACHDGYTSMYVYLRCPTPRKPFAELDPSPILFSRPPER